MFIQNSTRGIHHEFRMVTRECKGARYSKGEEVIFIRYGPYIGVFFPYIGGIFTFLVHAGDVPSLQLVNPLGNCIGGYNVM